MASEEHVRLLREGDRRYLIGASKSDLRRHGAKIADERDWPRIREDIEVEMGPSEGGGETSRRSTPRGTLAAGRANVRSTASAVSAGPASACPALGPWALPFAPMENGGPRMACGNRRLATDRAVEAQFAFC